MILIPIVGLLIGLLTLPLILHALDKVLERWGGS